MDKEGTSLLNEFYFSFFLPFFSFLCITVTRETFNDAISRTWRPFCIVIRFFIIKDRSDRDVRSSGSSLPDTIATLPLNMIIYARDLKDSLIKEHFFHCIHTHVYLYDELYDFKKSEELKVSIFILIRSNIKRNVMIKIWRLKRKKVIRTSWGSRHKGETKRKKKKRWTQHGNGERKISTAFQFIFRF